MKLEDGTGKGNFAQVDTSNRVLTFSVTEPEDKAQNKIGEVWSVHANTTPVGANDYIFYFKNTGSTTIAITDIRVSAAGASTLYIQKVTGTPTFAAGADLTPLARNLGSSKTITATIKEDTNTTGLTSEGLIFFIECPVAATLYHLSTSSNIIVPQGQAIAMYTDGTTAVESLWSMTTLA
jgi:hypothetical protein